MELYGSLHNISGSVTASAFSGSFKGDGGGLYNLPASGVTGLNLSQIASGNATASISSTGFTVNTNTTIQGNLSVTGSITATNYIVSSSVTYMTTSFASGSSAFGNDGNDVHQFTGSVQITGSISLNGQAIGTGKLDETTFQSYTSSISSSIGSLSSSIALTDVSQSNRLTTIEGNYATTGSNLFKGSQTISGSIIPSVDNTYDLGSSTYQWRDVYISSGSLYIDGTKVLGSTSQELTITTDTGQSIKILEAGSDSIILQSADGDIELKSSGGGDILFDPTNGIISIKGTTQIQDGFKITSSGGTNIVFGDSIIVSGSIELTGNVDGIDLQSFSSSVSASIGSLLGGNTSLSSSIATTTSGLSSSIGSLSSSVATTTYGLSSSIGSLSSSVATTTSGLTSTITSVSSSLTSSIGSLSSSIATTTSGLSSSIGSLSSSVATTINDLSSSVATTTLTTKNRVDSIEISTGSLNTFTGSINTTIKSKLDSESVISGSVQILITGTTGYSTFSSSVSTSIGELSSSVATTTSGLSSSIGSLSSSVATTTLNTKNRVDSIETSTGSLNTFTSSASGRLTSLETASGSIRTDFNTYTGSNNTTNTTQDGRLTSIEGITGSISSLNTYTGSNNTVIGTLQTSTSSLNSYTSSNTTNIDAIHTSTGSFKSFTSSFDTAFGMSGADVTVKGNLTVSGTQTTVNSTTVAIGDNIIQLNGTGATNAGLVVRDATAPNTVSGSFLWDSTNDKWIAGALGSEDDVVLKTATQTLTNKTINASQLVDASVTNAKLQYSSLSIAGTSVSLNGSISAATILSGTGTVSGSSQISHDSTTGYVANRHIDHTAVSISAGNGLSGGGDISTTRTISLDTTSATFTTGVKSKMNADGVISGSAQISFNGITDKPTLVSGSSQITYGSLSGIPTGIVSGSSQITFGSISSIPSGLVSGSSQIDLTATTNYASGILTRLNAVGVFSGSAQVSLASTTGFGTYLNQAVLTTSTPTFSTVTATTFTGALSGNASTATTASALTSMNISQFTNNSGYITSSGNITGYAMSLNGYANQTVYTILDGPANGPVIKIRYDSATANRYIDIGSKDGNGVYSEGLKLYNGSTMTWLGYTVYHSGNVPTWNQNTTGTASNITAYTINQSVGTSNSPTFVDTTLTGGLTIGGSLSRGTYISSSNYVTGADNIVLKGNSSGVSGIFFESEKDGTNINHPSDFAFIQYFPYGIGGSSGEANRLVIGTSNDADDMIVMNPVDINGLKLRVGAGTTDYTIYHSGNVPTWNQNTTGTAANITAYTINQSVGTGNAPTFAGGTINGSLYVNANNDITTLSGSLTLYSTGNATTSMMMFKNTTGLGYGNHGAITGTYNTYFVMDTTDRGWVWRNATTSTNIASISNTGTFTVNGNVMPTTNNSSNLGSASVGWANVYTNDLHLSNMNKPEGNDVDGTNGNWTIQEGSENLYIINNNNGKKFKIYLTEII